MELEAAERRVFTTLKGQGSDNDPKQDLDKNKDKQPMVCFSSEEEARQKLCPCQVEAPPKETSGDPEEEPTSDDSEEE